MLKPALLALGLTLALPAFAAASEGLQRTFAERTALLATDQRCALFAPGVRAALEAGAAQARSALLRQGWTNPQADALAGRARDLSQRHACDAAPVKEASRSAQAGFTAFSRMLSMRFPGQEQGWFARRLADMDGWLAFQDVADRGRFGLRSSGGVLQAAFTLPLATSATAPSSARLILRDRARAPTSPLDIPGRRAGRLADNAPPPGLAEQVFAITRSVKEMETPGVGRAAVFTFPPAVLERVARLDPREAAVVELDTNNGPRRYLIEIGDLAAALAFLRAGP